MESAESVLDEFTRRQGWDTDSQLLLALAYIDNQQSPQAWRDFLAEQADTENGGTHG